MSSGSPCSGALESLSKTQRVSNNSAVRSWAWLRRRELWSIAAFWAFLGTYKTVHDPASPFFRSSKVEKLFQRAMLSRNIVQSLESTPISYPPTLCASSSRTMPSNAITFSVTRWCSAFGPSSVFKVGNFSKRRLNRWKVTQAVFKFKMEIILSQIQKLLVMHNRTIRKFYNKLGTRN